MKFKAKKNDKLHLFTKNGHGYFAVEGFYCYGVKFYDTGIYPFHAKSFYSCAYKKKFAYFIVKKRWQYPFAVIIQFISIKKYSIKQFIFTRYMAIKHRIFN